MKPCAIIFHFPCFDGLASALLAESYLKQKGLRLIEFHRYSYGRKFTPIKPYQYEEILIVDLPFNVIADLFAPGADSDFNASCALITWIDHHPLPDGEDGKFTFASGVTEVKVFHNADNEQAACGLAFENLAHSYTEPSFKSYPLMRAIDCCDRGVAPSTLERAVYYQIIYGNKNAMNLDYLRKYLGLTYSSPLVIEISRLHIKTLPGLEHSGVETIDNILHSFVRSNRHRILCLNVDGVQMKAMEIYIADQSGLIVQEYIKFARTYKIAIDFIVRVKNIHNTDNVLVIMRRVNDRIDLNTIAKKYGSGGHPGAATFMTTFADWQSMIMNHDKS